MYAMLYLCHNKIELKNKTNKGNFGKTSASEIMAGISSEVEGLEEKSGLLKKDLEQCEAKAQVTASQKVAKLTGPSSEGPGAP